MRVTTKLVKGTGPGTAAPSLFEVLIDGQRVQPAPHGISAARVLKMGPRYVPVLDNVNPQPFGFFQTRKQCAEWLAEIVLLMQV